jgi:hypothetical protein
VSGLGSLEALMNDPSLRLTVTEALDWMLKHQEIRASRLLTAHVLQSVERSGYDRGHAVATAECNATEPREERDE